MIGNIAAALYGTGVPPVTSSYESIATVTVGSGGASYAEFTSIPSTYKHLQIRCSIRGSNNNYQLVRLNSDSASNYAYHYMYGTGSAVGAGNVTSTSSMGFTDTTNSASIFNALIIDILDYASTSKNKTLRGLGGFDTNGGGFISMNSGLWFKTPEAINTIRFTPDNGTYAEYSTFALYGIKD
jgi:hypothetical protein